MRDAVRMRGVGKRYPDFELEGIELELPAGSVMGLIGPNGAGKSTTMRMLMGLVRQDEGEIEVLGRPVPAEQVAVKRDIGFVSEDMRLYDAATIRWHMGFVKSVYPGWDSVYAEELVGRFELRPDQKVRGLSHGQRVKTTLLLALAHRPRLLILDEPTTGLDPVARFDVLGELMEVIADGERSILFSSHNTQDVEQISDLITFVDRGRIIASRDKESYLESWRRLRLEVPDDRSVPALPGLVPGLQRGRLRVATTNRFDGEIVSQLEAAGVSVRAVEPLTLEEIFVATVRLHREESS